MTAEINVTQEMRELLGHALDVQVKKSEGVTELGAVADDILTNADDVLLRAIARARWWSAWFTPSGAFAVLQGND